VEGRSQGLLEILFGNMLEWTEADSEDVSCDGRWPSNRVWLHGAVFKILRQRYFVCKCSSRSVSIVSSGLRVYTASKRILLNWTQEYVNRTLRNGDSNGIRSRVIKFANSPPCACRGSTGHTAIVWFDDVDISGFYSCVVDLWQSLSEWHLLLSACVLVCRRENVGAWIKATNERTL